MARVFRNPEIARYFKRNVGSYKLTEGRENRFIRIIGKTARIPTKLIAIREERPSRGVTNEMDERFTKAARESSSALSMAPSRTQL